MPIMLDCNTIEAPNPISVLAVKTAIARAILASIAFQVAFSIPALNCLVLLGAYWLIRMRRVQSPRLAFRLGFLSGMLIFAPQLAWFWRIFGLASICLWAILSVFTGLFVIALHSWGSRYGAKWLILA